MESEENPLSQNGYLGNKDEVKQDDNVKLPILKNNLTLSQIKHSEVSHQENANTLQQETSTAKIRQEDNTVLPILENQKISVNKSSTNDIKLNNSNELPLFNDEAAGKTLPTKNKLESTNNLTLPQVKELDQSLLSQNPIDFEDKPLRITQESIALEIRNDPINEPSNEIGIELSDKRPFPTVRTSFSGKIDLPANNMTEAQTKKHTLEKKTSETLPRKMSSRLASIERMRKHITSREHLEILSKPNDNTKYKKKILAEVERRKKAMEAALKHKPSERTLTLARPTKAYFTLYGENGFDLTKRLNPFPETSAEMGEDVKKLLPSLRQVEVARPTPNEISLYSDKMIRNKKPKLILFPPPHKPLPQPVSDRILDLSTPRQNWMEIRKKEIKEMEKVYKVSEAALTAVASARIQELAKPKELAPPEPPPVEEPPPERGRRQSVMLAPAAAGEGGGLAMLGGLGESAGRRRQSVMLSFGGGVGEFGSGLSGLGEAAGRRRQSVMFGPTGGLGEDSGGRRRQSVVLGSDFTADFSGLRSLADYDTEKSAEEKKEEPKEELEEKEEEKSISEIVEDKPPEPFVRRSSYINMPNYPFGILQEEYRETPEAGDDETHIDRLKRFFSSIKRSRPEI